MKVLLISANTEQINMPVLPMGTACIAAAAQDAGHDVKIVNLMAQQQDIRSLLKEAVNGFPPDVIGISVRNIDDQCMASPKFLLEPVKKVVAECRSLSDAPVVLGGAGYSIFPQTALAYLKADMGIRGEGERAFAMLLERLERKADLSDVPGLYLAESGLMKTSGFMKNLDAFPMPLPNVHLNVPRDLKKEDIWIPFQTRRGCPMNCTYCSTATIEGRLLRKHSPEYAMEGLRSYAQAGFDRFFFVDNTFNFPPSYAETLCDRIISERLNIRWRCILYPHKVSEMLIEKMAKAGCCEVSLGSESGSHEILKGMNKRFGPDDVRRISESLGKNGIRYMAFLLLGGPGETKETIQESLAFTDSLNAEAVRVTSGIRIYPDTELCRTALREGLIRSEEELLFPKFYMTRGLEDWLQKTIGDWSRGRPNWIIA
jgi:radical SAM superfamily enzyme YgiQ (UPF0313 family)